MDIKDIKLGTKFELTVIDSYNNHSDKIYISQLEEILDSNTIIISTPIHEGNIVPISVDSHIRIVFFHTKGLFTFNGIVRSRGRRDNILILKVEAETKLKKIQRRNFFRFEWLMNVKFRVIEDENKRYAEGETPYIDTYIRDISGGGVALITTEKQNIGTIIEIQLNLDGDIMTVIGEVVRAEIYENDKNKYEIGIKFIDITQRDRDRIVKFIFHKQIKLMQKGMV